MMQCLLINDGKRRGDSAPVINVITTSDYAKQRLENFANYADEVIDHALEIWNIQSEVVEKGITRWSIAQPSPAKRPQLPDRLAIASLLRPIDETTVCVPRKKDGPCLLVFHKDAGSWRLVGFEGDTGMLRTGPQR